MAETIRKQRHHQQWINRVWYGRSLISPALLPLSGLYWALMSIRKAFFHSVLVRPRKFEFPVIVVGNITVGGTGKTPMVIYLCEALKQLGYRPGVASRGYGGEQRCSTLVDASHRAHQVGDEPLLIHQRSGMPVVVGSNRIKVIEHLICKQQCNIVICDDGLQDYRFVHDIEITMVDSDRCFGNRRLLPAGPLRESIKKVFNSDFCVVAGHPVQDISADTMQYSVNNVYHLNQAEHSLNLTALRGKPVHAVAGIANPQRFFDLLTAHGLQVIPHPLDDHTQLSPQNLQFPDDNPVLITEKDAVKCTQFKLENVWVLPVTAQLPATFLTRIEKLLREQHG